MLTRVSGMADDDDDEHDELAELDGIDHERNVLGSGISRDAFMLHAFATVHTTMNGSQGFVGDDYLCHVDASDASDASVLALELCTAGRWERVDGGYRILDIEAVNHVVEFQEESGRSAAECQARGRHLPTREDDGQGWLVCSHCVAPLRRGDGKPVAGADGSPPDYTGWR